MDIEYLLILQTIREGVGSCLTDFFSKMTWIGDMSVVMVIMGLIYWCVSKEIGTYLLMGWSGNRIVNGFLKVTGCVYRPWIRDARVIPDAAAQAGATGYSFPSGHSVNAASLFGGMAIRKGVRTGFKVLLWIILVLIAFSRNFLGVHTPQDVLVGAGSGILVMFLTGKLLAWLSTHQDKDILIAVIGVIIAVAVAIYAALKPYPEDFDASGKLLVDGMKMANDTFKAVGWMSAFMVGWILELRFVKFSTEVSMQQRFFRLTGGLLGYYMVNLIINPPIKSAVSGFAGIVITCFLQMFYIVFLFPWIISLLERKNVEKG